MPASVQLKLQICLQEPQNKTEGEKSLSDALKHMQQPSINIWMTIDYYYSTTTNGLPWTASSLNLHTIIRDDNIDGLSGRDNVVGKAHFELLDAAPQDDPAGAPVVGRDLNSHVGQVVRSAPEQHKHAPGGGKAKAKQRGSPMM